MPNRWTISPRNPGLLGLARDVYTYRRLLAFLSREATLQVYRRALLGVAWLVIRPSITAITSIFIVGGVLKASTAPIPLSAFIVSGLALWTLFTRGVHFGTRSLAKGRWITRRVHLPKFLLVLAALAPAAIEFAVVLVGACGVIAYYGFQGHLTVSASNLLVALPSLILVLTLVLSVTCITSIFMCLATDVAMVTRYGLVICFLVTPVVYPLTLLQPDKQWLAYLNPLCVALELWRNAFFGSPAPDALFVGIAFVGATALLLCSLGFFAYYERLVGDRE